MATRIPVNKDGGLGGFDDPRQKRVWQEMETDMERRRREWEEEINKMRKEFFMLRPEDEDRLGGGLGGVGVGAAGIPLGIGDRLGPRSRLLETSSTAAEDSRGMVVKDDKGNPVFKVLFDVHDYCPEEVSVKMDDNKVMVSARHEAQKGGSSVSREYSRKISIPSNIDPVTLQCTMGPDGILAVEAPIPAPSYATLKDTATSLPIRTASPGAGGSAGPSSAASSTTPVQQSTSSTTYQSSYHGGEGGYPAGYKPVSAQLQNSAPPSGPSSLAYSSSSREPTTSSSGAGFSKAGQPYQAAAPSYSSPAPQKGGRIGSPVVVSEPGKFKVEIDIEDFKPEELTVKTQDQRVVVCAKRQEKVGLSTSTRELSKERTLPDNVDPLTIKAFFTDGGKLIIEAPYTDGAQASR